MIKLLLVSIVLTGVTVLLHGIGTLCFIKRLLRLWNRKQYSIHAYYGLTLTNVLTGDMQAANDNHEKLKRLSPELAATAAAIVGQNP